MHRQYCHHGNFYTKRGGGIFDLQNGIPGGLDSDSDTFTVLSSRLDCYKYSFFPKSSQVKSM